MSQAAKKTIVFRVTFKKKAKLTKDEIKVGVKFLENALNDPKVVREIRLRHHNLVMFGTTHPEMFLSEPTIAVVNSAETEKRVLRSIKKFHKKLRAANRAARLKKRKK